MLLLLRHRPGRHPRPIDHHHALRLFNISPVFRGLTLRNKGVFKKNAYHNICEFILVKILGSHLQTKIWHWLKSVQIQSFFWSVFQVYGLNTDIYRVILRIQSKYRKIRTRKKPHIWRLFTQWSFFNYSKVLIIWGTA